MGAEDYLTRNIMEGGGGLSNYRLSTPASSPFAPAVKGAGAFAKAFPWVMLGTDLLGSGLQAWLTFKGIDAQKKAQEEANRFNLELFNKQTQFEAGQQRKEIKALAKENYKKRNYERSVSFLDSFTTLMNSQPRMASNLVKLTRGME